MQSKWIHEIEGLENCKGYKVYEDGTIKSYKNVMDMSILLWTIQQEHSNRMLRKKDI